MIVVSASSFHPPPVSPHSICSVHVSVPYGTVAVVCSASMYRSKILLVASFLLFFAWASASSAAPLHLTCHDGDPLVRKRVGFIAWATCDSLVDGVCNFSMPGPPCACPFVGCCGGGEFSVPVKGKATELDITDEMRAACESIVPPICETMMDLMARVEPEYQHKVRNNVIVAGGSSLIPGLPDVLDRALSELGGGRTSVVKDPIFAGSDGGLAIARDATSADWERLAV